MVVHFLNFIYLFWQNITSKEAQAKLQKVAKVSVERLFIILQAPRAGGMQQILCSDWLPEQARWSDTACPILPLSFSQIKFCQSSSSYTKVFFPEN